MIWGKQHPLEIIVELLLVFSGIDLFCPLSPLTSTRDPHSLPPNSSIVKNPPTGTQANNIRHPTCMLPMLILVHASSRAVKMVNILFCVGMLILAHNHTQLHNALWLERLLIIVFLSSNDTIFLCNILADCLMQRRLEWGAMAAVGQQQSLWLADAWFS